MLTERQRGRTLEGWERRGMGGEYQKIMRCVDGGVVGHGTRQARIKKVMTFILQKHCLHWLNSSLPRHRGQLFYERSSELLRENFDVNFA